MASRPRPSRVVGEFFTLIIMKCDWRTRIEDRVATSNDDLKSILSFAHLQAETEIKNDGICGIAGIFPCNPTISLL